MKVKTTDYCVYRYLLPETGQIIYIGKTDASLRQRINAHEKEEKFAPYLGQWKIEYVPLANRVETDIVEKYLINELKPVLNDKDCVEGLTSMQLRLPGWVPYEYYEEKRREGAKALLANALKTARADEAFFWAVYNAVLSKETVITTPFLHPTGMLPCPKERRRVVFREVVQDSSGYRQKMLPGIAENFLQLPYYILLNIWEPVMKRWTFHETEQHKLSQYRKYLSFAGRLVELKENGFQEDCDSEPYLLTFEADPVLESYYAIFFGKVIHVNKSAFAEIDPEAFGNLSSVIDRIASDMLTWLKAIGVIPYASEDE